MTKELILSTSKLIAINSVSKEAGATSVSKMLFITLKDDMRNKCPVPSPPSQLRQRQVYS